MTADERRAHLAISWEALRAAHPHLFFLVAPVRDGRKPSPGVVADYVRAANAFFAETFPSAEYDLCLDVRRREPESDAFVE